MSPGPKKTQDTLIYGPEPDALLEPAHVGGEKVHQQTDAAGEQIYRAPKIHPVAMEEDAAERRSRRQKRQEKEANRRANQNDMVNQSRLFLYVVFLTFYVKKFFNAKVIEQYLQ